MEDENQQIIVVRKKIKITSLQQQARELYGLMIKIVVDVRQMIMAVGGELHADAEQILLEQSARQEDLWGANIYPFEKDRKKLIEFNSLINIRPSQENFSMNIEDKSLRVQMTEIIFNLIDFNDR